MKKLLLVLFAVFLLGILSVAVYGLTNYGIVKNDQVTAKDVVYGSSSDIPYLRSTFKLYKGWNLIPLPGEGIAAPERTANVNFFGYSNKMGCGNKENDFSGYQVKYAYVYVPTKGYLGGRLQYNNNGFEDSTQQEIQNAISSYYITPEMGGNDGIWSYMISSEWVYSDMECEYPLAQLDVQRVERAGSSALQKMKLASGWNLVYLFSSLYGKNIKDIIGNCDIISVNQWDPINQKWQFSASESKQQVAQFLNMKVDTTNLYTPFVIKVSNTCALGNSITQPPVIPN